jgi:hypothetical protein
MKNAKAFLAALVLVGSVATSGIAVAQDGVIEKEVLTPNSYCHEKFPAIDNNTLGNDKPVLQSATSGDTIDFYGPCDENPVGQDQVQAQLEDNQLRWSEAH